MDPTISVLLPVYNAESYIRLAVESVLAQTFRNFELLVLDDGSTDGSQRILHELEAKDDRMRVITRENLGLIPTLNELIELARGRYLARMDADDICLPNRFEKQVQFLEENSSYVLVGGQVERINARGQRIGVYVSPCEHDMIDQAHLHGSTSICHPASMWRRFSSQEFGYREEFAPSEDLDLWLRLAEIGKVANIPSVVLKYRIHPASLSEALGEAQYRAMRRACEAAWRRREIVGHFEPAEHWRPGKDRASRHRFAISCGWTAWGNGYTGTWWTYVREALVLRPLSMESWRLLVFGLLKSPAPK